MNYESLFILFKADTSDLKKGTKEAEQSTNKLKDSLKETNTFSDTLEKSFGRLAASVSAVVAAGLSASALFSGLKEATEFSTQLAYQADQLGVNVENLNAWDKAIEHVGGTAADVAASIEGLHEKFGIPKEQAFDVLKQLADPLSKMTANNAQIYGKAYGLTPAMITLLREGNVQLAALLLKQKELYGLTEKDAEVFKGLNDEVLNTKNSIQHLFIEMAIAAAPAFEAILKGIQATFGWILKHGDLIKGFFVGLSVSLAAVAGYFAVAAISAGILLSPIILISTGVLALAGAIAYLNEKFHILDSNSEFWSKIKDNIDHAYGPLKMMIDGVKTLIDGLKELNEWSDKLFKRAIEKSTGATFDINHFVTANDLTGFKTPLSSTTSNAISNSTKNSSNYNAVTNITGNTVVTQSTDPHAAFRDLQDKHLASQYSKAANGFADGNAR